MMQKERATRNRTLTCNPEEEALYFSRCLQEEQTAYDLQTVCNHTICGDCLQIAKRLPEKSVDLMIVDPPYNMNKTFHGNTFTKKHNAEYEQYTIEWLQAMLPLLKDTASVYVCCDWSSSLIIGRVLEDFLIVQNRITWQREKGRGAKHNWKNGMEDIWFATKSKDYTFCVDAVKLRKRVLAPYRENGKPKDWEDTEQGRYRDTYPSNFWDDISIPFWSMPENTDHPTQKPEKLLAKLILASSNPNDVVFDPFLGSGTTSVVCKKLHRRYIGIEQNPLYCAWAEKRLAQAETEPSIQGYTDGVFWERNTLSAQKSAKK